MARVIYADDKNIQLSYEVLNDCLVVHVELHDVTKAVIERLKVVWEYMKRDAYFDGWENIFTYTKDPRIVNLVGGAEEVVDPKLEEIGLRVFKWELK